MPRARLSSRLRARCGASPPPPHRHRRTHTTQYGGPPPQVTPTRRTCTRWIGRRPGHVSNRQRAAPGPRRSFRLAKILRAPRSLPRTRHQNHTASSLNGAATTDPWPRVSLTYFFFQCFLSCKFFKNDIFSSFTIARGASGRSDTPPSIDLVLPAAVGVSYLYRTTIANTSAVLPEPRKEIGALA